MFPLPGMPVVPPGMMNPAMLQVCQHAAAAAYHPGLQQLGGGYACGGHDHAVQERRVLTPSSLQPNAGHEHAHGWASTARHDGWWPTHYNGGRGPAPSPWRPLTA